MSGEAYPFGAAIGERVEVLVQEVGEAGVILHRDLARGRLQYADRRQHHDEGMGSETRIRTLNGVTLKSTPVFWLS